MKKKSYIMASFWSEAIFKIMCEEQNRNGNIFYFI